MGIREAARQAGARTYLGAPCINCQSMLKYTNGGRCVACTKLAASQWGKENRAAKAKIGQASHRKSRYGVSKDTYAGMVLAQRGLCQICDQPCATGHSLGIDHDHSCCPRQEKTCGKCVRGLLCKRCNRLIGDANESTAILLAAAAYLQRYGK